MIISDNVTLYVFYVTFSLQYLFPNKTNNCHHFYSRSNLYCSADYTQSVNTITVKCTNHMLSMSLSTRWFTEWPGYWANYRICYSNLFASQIFSIIIFNTKQVPNGNSRGPQFKWNIT